MTTNTVEEKETCHSLLEQMAQQMKSFEKEKVKEMDFIRQKVRQEIVTVITILSQMVDQL